MNNLIKIKQQSKSVKIDKISEVYKREILDTRIAVADLAKGVRIVNASKAYPQERDSMKKLHWTIHRISLS